MTLLPARYNFAVWEGATFRKTVTLLSGDQNSVPRDLTGYTAAMNIRTAPDVAPIYSLTTVNGKITLGGSAGTISLYIPAIDTLTFDSWENGIYDLTITNTGGTGDTEAVLWGNFAVKGIA